MWLSLEPSARNLPSGENFTQSILSFPSECIEINCRVVASITIHRLLSVVNMRTEPSGEKVDDWTDSPKSLLQTTECDNVSHK